MINMIDISKDDGVSIINYIEKMPVQQWVMYYQSNKKNPRSLSVMADLCGDAKMVRNYTKRLYDQGDGVVASRRNASGGFDYFFKKIRRL